MINDNIIFIYITKESFKMNPMGRLTGNRLRCAEVSKGKGKVASRSFVHPINDKQLKVEGKWYQFLV